MSFLSAAPRRPLCISCLRRLAFEDVAPSFGPLHLQLRGKKKVAKKPDTINVKLLVDMKGYGRKGVVTPVAPGRMRNAWYPRQQAEYLSTVSDVNARAIVPERDFLFGMEKEQKQEEAADRATAIQTPVKAKVRLLTPQISTEVISELLPSRFIFHRVAITEPEPEPVSDDFVKSPTSGRRKAASQAAAELEAAAAPTVTVPIKPKIIPIFGSVTTADIAEDVIRTLSKDKDGKRVVIGAEDVRILGVEGGDSGVEPDRVKVLGDFEFTVTVKGGTSVQRRATIQTPES